MRNHSATHLLHSALRKILGAHVVQRGSLVAPDRLRFDFAHFDSLKPEELIEVENLVNTWILANEESKIHLTDMEKAKALGALALFGEKYGSEVRVLEMGSHSTELCGGTHCKRTGDIGSFHILSEGPLAQGIRRIEAVTGLTAVKDARHNENLLKALAKDLGVKKEEIAARIDRLQSELAALEKSARAQSTGSLKERAQKIVSQAEVFGSAKLVSDIIFNPSDNEDLRLYADMLRDLIGTGVVLLGVQLDQEKCQLLIAATKDLGNLVHAGKIIGQIAPLIGGKGGGRPDFAQAGGTKASLLPKALKEASTLIIAELKRGS